jgi:hypothetical protein
MYNIAFGNKGQSDPDFIRDGLLGALATQGFLGGASLFLNAILGWHNHLLASFILAIVSYWIGVGWIVIKGKPLQKSDRFAIRWGYPCLCVIGLIFTQ